MLTEEIKEQVNRWLIKAVHDIAEIEAEKAVEANEYIKGSSYVEGYEKGYWDAFIAAEKQWKSRADKYNELIESGVITDETTT